MSRFGAQFLHSFKSEIGDEVDPNFKTYGNLYLVNEQNAEKLAQGVALQSQLGVKSELLTNDQLKKKFPWINTDGIGLGMNLVDLIIIFVNYGLFRSCFWLRG